MKALADLGVSRFVVPPLTLDPAALPEAMERFAEEFIGKV